jgi:hypothetical protein
MLADARRLDSDSLACAVFRLIENEGGPDYLSIAHTICDALRFTCDGLVVPGVRPDSREPDSRYFNVVLFNFEGWIDWVLPDVVRE